MYIVCLWAGIVGGGQVERFQYFFNNVTIFNYHMLSVVITLEEVLLWVLGNRGSYNERHCVLY